MRKLVFATVLFTFSAISCQETDIPKPNQEVIMVGNLVAEEKPAPNNWLFDPNASFTVSAFRKFVTPYRSVAKDTAVCNAWYIPSSILSEIIRTSVPVNETEWHYSYEHMPCHLKGKIYQGERSFETEINAGSWLTIISGDSIRIFACHDPAYRQYFLASAGKFH